MRLDPDTWHVKWYYCASTLFEAWKGNEPRTYDGIVFTNICPYVRRMLVTFPLLVVLYGAVLWWAIQTMIIWPTMWFGFSYYAWVGTVIAGIAAFVGFIIGLCYLCPAVGRWWTTYLSDPFSRAFWYVAERADRCIMGKPDAPGFCAVLRQWIIDGHHKICREIEIIPRRDG